MSQKLKKTEEDSRTKAAAEAAMAAWTALAPYPSPTKQQERLVSRVEFLATILSTVVSLLSFLFKPISFLISLSRRRAEAKQWLLRESAVPDNEKVPPEQHAVFVANHTQAMDQNFYYVLKQGRIWFKPIAAPKLSSWKLLGPDGRPPSGAKLTSISSDGINIIGLDEQRVVHYVHSDGINVSVSDTDWHIHQIDLDWTDHWLSIPIAARIIGRIRGHQLKLPDHCHAFAISQKGPEAGYYTDMSGKNQPEFLVGVTTLYALSNDGRIYFADPWLPHEFRNEITAPEDGQFVAESIAAAASTLFLLRRNADGTPCMYTRFADFDSMGSNPLLPASYDPDNTLPLVRRLPAEDWLKQPAIQLVGQAKLTSKIAIIQTGRGQQNRQLRVEGTNKEGIPGYYMKGIYEKEWGFEPTPEVTLSFDKPITLGNPPPPPVNLSVERFTTSVPLPIKTIELKNFLRHGLNERGLHTVICITLKNGGQLELPMYASRGLDHFLGRRPNSPNWVLVLPAKYKQEPRPEVQATLKALFQHKTSISVTVDEAESGDITICTKDKAFQCKFSPTANKKNLLDEGAPFNATSIRKTAFHLSLSPINTSVSLPGTPAHLEDSSNPLVLGGVK